MLDSKLNCWPYLTLSLVFILQLEFLVIQFATTSKFTEMRKEIFQWNSILSELQKLLVVLLFFIHIYYIWREIMVCSSKYFLLYQLLNFCSILCPWFWYIFNSLLYNQLISNLIHANRLGRLVQYMKIGANYWVGKISLNLFVLGSVFALPWIPIFFFLNYFQTLRSC